MNRAKRELIMRKLQEHNPAPTTELLYQSPFELLVAVILSAQATDISVNKATRKLFARANTPRAMLQLGVEQLKSHIRTIGLYNTKAHSIIRTCKILDEEYAGQVPDQREALERLPGVGRKTANVILNTVFGQAVIAVDTHIFRVANRTRLATGRTVMEVEKKLLNLIPKAYHVNAHHWLILHGRYTCTARAPRCRDCIIQQECEWPDKCLGPD